MYIIYKSSDYIRINIHILSYIPFFQNLVLTFLITTYLLDEHKKKETTHYEWFLFCVELEGVEPSSKRGNHKLSTCLSLPDFSCNGRTKAINHYLILLSFTQSVRPLQAIPDVTTPLNRNASEQQLPSDVSSWHLVPGLS